MDAAGTYVDDGFDDCDDAVDDGHEAGRDGSHDAVELGGGQSAIACEMLCARDGSRKKLRHPSWLLLGWCLFGSVDEIEAQDPKKTVVMLGCWMLGDGAANC